ncbi:hypothetical protein KJS94_15085 [Flavihumibacter rivuli]|uniref:hypothetical protein n=2 Tax=Flavihumibacter rivuli TaxID=2838156 RepID=UPI001EFB909F|nr:hypothetical protein [Flavihumibacter rivuli]ULQ55972.1 hypothetical protein KJS94_15085 [Flavihumibacter rivuli]
MYVVRHFMRPQILAYLLFTLTACGQTKDKSQKGTGIPKITTTQKQTKNMSDYSPTFDKAHPKAKVLLKEDFYFSPIDETGPFGNDDGADTYAGFKDWRTNHINDDPADFLFDQINKWGYPKFDIYETDINKLTPYLKESELSSRYMSGIDAAIISIAFGQFYLEGTIYSSFKETAIIAIKRQLMPEILSLWGDTYKIERELKLNKMLAVLNQIN